ncbi:Chemotaxis protein CheC -- inhibitor of MCP methylation [Alkalibacterium sp. AK22]|uniref:chemotaxis protein CheC n=1 Tax=Alkalibacterium sp. AK22 TaxID=1229520 RepID=UPI00044D347C|nr:chemotaxis protein CheC [Alkalibacterium sp. AK22]EXJ22364.1 Chemotaxis protein CheC -- inhibitor of MCP methylation [Alkalibacterium sp. AK22]
MTKDHALLRYDALQEVVNIGGGHAATSLSKMIGRPVDMDVPFVEVLSYEEVYQTIQADDTIVKAVLSELIGGKYGVFLFMTDPKDAEKLAQMLLPGQTDYSEELVDSALKELSNILFQSFLQAVMELIGKPLIASLPVLTTDLFGSILSSVYMQQEQFSEELFIIKNNFYSEGHKIEGSLYFVPKPDTLEQLLHQLGI